MTEGAASQAPDSPSAVDNTHPVVQRVGDVQHVPCGVPGKAIRRIELGRRRRTAVTRKTEAARASDRADHRGQRDPGLVDGWEGDGGLADLVRKRIRDIDVEAA